MPYWSWLYTGIDAVIAAATPITAVNTNHAVSTVINTPQPRVLTHLYSALDNAVKNWVPKKG